MNRAFLLCGALLSLSAFAQTPNALTARDAKAGWKMLWDGKTGQGWHTAKGGSIPNQGWQIEGGTLTLLHSDGHGHEFGGDLLTDEDFGDFELSVDFKTTPGGNSGIKYFVNTDKATGGDPAIGFEYQLLDDDVNPDAKLGRDGNRTEASLYDMIPAAAGKPYRPIGEWNTARIVVRGAHGEHWLNGTKVLEYERFTPVFRQLVAQSKYKDLPHFGELRHGHIQLQDHGDGISFRNIKIRVLGPPSMKVGS